MVRPSGRKVMRAILVTAGQDVKEVNIDASLDGIYECLGCDIIDIARRSIGGQPYCFVVDDMGLLRDDPIVTAYSRSREPMLVGNLLITNEKHTPEGGDLADLTDIDVKHIMKHVLTVQSYRGVYEVVEIG